MNEILKLKKCGDQVLDKTGKLQKELKKKKNWPMATFEFRLNKNDQKRTNERARGGKAMVHSNLDGFFI